MTDSRQDGTGDRRRQAHRQGDRRGSCRARLCRGDPLQPLASTKAEALAERDRAQPAARAAVVEADLTDMARPRRLDRPRRLRRSGRSACWSTTPRSSRTIPSTISISPSGTGISPSMSKRRSLLARQLCRRAAGRSGGPDRQHHRPARLAADAALFLLHAVEVGAVDGDADAGAGAGAAASASMRSAPDRRLPSTRQADGTISTRRSTG